MHFTSLRKGEGTTMSRKLVIEDGGGRRPEEIQFEGEAGETVGVRPVALRFLNRFTGRVDAVFINVDENSLRMYQDRDAVHKSKKPFLPAPRCTLMIIAPSFLQDGYIAER